MAILRKAEQKTANQSRDVGQMRPSVA